MADFVVRLLREQPLGAFGAFVALILLFTGIFADVLAPYGMNDTSVIDRLKPPSAEHWLGTDDLGRDLLSRIIYGARISMIVGLMSALVSTLVSLLIGVVSGYIGGKFDLIVQRFVDAVMSFPILILLIVIISIVGPGLWQVIVVLGVRSGIVVSRVLRSDTLRIKSNLYVQAAEAIGSSSAWIMWRHILPNIMPTVVIMFATRMPALILLEAALSFLGFGVPPPAPSWGGMLSGSGSDFMFLAPWMAIWPGLALAIVVFGINMLGDAVRDIIDPRMKGGAGRFDVSVGLSEDGRIKRNVMPVLFGRHRKRNALDKEAKRADGKV